MKTQIALAALLTLAAINSFAAPQRPGIGSQKIAECKSAPQRSGDSAVPGIYAATVTFETREFQSYYQVTVTSVEEQKVVSTMQGQADQNGQIILARRGLQRAGSSENFVLNGALGEWSQIPDFGPARTLMFICN